MGVYFYRAITKIYEKQDEPFIILNNVGEIKYKNNNAKALLREHSIVKKFYFTKEFLIHWVSMKKNYDKSLNKRSTIWIMNELDEQVRVTLNVTYVKKKDLYLCRIISINSDEESNHYRKKNFNNVLKMFSDLNQGVVISDLNGIIVDYNHIASNQFQLSKETKTYFQYEEIFNSFEYDKEELMAYYKRISSDKYSEIIVHKVEGNKRSAVKLISYVNEDPQFLITSFTSRDEKPALTSDLGSNIFGHSTASIVHEINNPLTSIKGYVQMLLKNPDINRSYLQVIDRELSKIESLTSDLLFLANPKNDLYQQNSLLPIVTEAIDSLQPQALMSDCLIQFEYDHTFDYYVNCNGLRIKQVLINLIKNSIEAMEQSGVGGDIYINLTQKENDYLITVRDNGPGINAQVLSEIFNPFFTTKRKGTGLGLSISNQLMNEHGGKILVDSELGAGTTFTLLLPMYDLAYLNTVVEVMAGNLELQNEESF